ncbi:hypothetical protein ILYODFUR_028392 [Ilyodon furcidens]|uniref:Secreted protein n=1 Tax=Ilyodon furcidens TaxID=33524 RepID=A0ABV0SRP4_9TELE
MRSLHTHVQIYVCLNVTPLCFWTAPELDCSGIHSLISPKTQALPRPVGGTFAVLVHFNFSTRENFVPACFSSACREELSRRVQCNALLAPANSLDCCSYQWVWAFGQTCSEFHSGGNSHAVVRSRQAGRTAPFRPCSGNVSGGVKLWGGPVSKCPNLKHGASA